VKLVRILLSLVVVGFALITLQKFVLHPYHCNQLLKIAKAGTPTAVPSQLPRAAVIATRNLDTLADCPEWCRSSVDALMVLAANERILKRYERALEYYDRALSIDLRPELLVNHAMTEYESGERVRSLDSLVRAVQFNYGTLAAIPDPTLRDEVRQRVLNPPPKKK
jgi:tetratricopeptide (TPR) repeat protein